MPNGLRGDRHRWQRWIVRSAVVISALVSVATAFEAAPSNPVAEPSSLDGGTGVVVESVDPGSTLAAAGLRPGDLLSRWERRPSIPAGAGAAGVLDSPFAWMGLEVEQALLDRRVPLDSGLALTIPEELTPGRENGLLQAREVIERLRLDADLVVLSACETGLGRELGGEGLIGLTRALQLAGARSVVASLWSVRDRGTADLMTRFHRHLSAGVSKDRALRPAKLELLREKGASVADWAGFQLYGDWR